MTACVVMRVVTTGLDGMAGGIVAGIISGISGRWLAGLAVEYRTQYRRVWVILYRVIRVVGNMPDTQ